MLHQPLVAQLTMINCHAFWWPFRQPKSHLIWIKIWIKNRRMLIYSIFFWGSKYNMMKTLKKFHHAKFEIKCKLPLISKETWVIFLVRLLINWLVNMPLKPSRIPCQCWYCWQISHFCVTVLIIFSCTSFITW